MHNPSMWKFKNKQFIRLLKLCYLRKEVINHITYSMKKKLHQHLDKKTCEQQFRYRINRLKTFLVILWPTFCYRLLLTDLMKTKQI